MMDVVILAGGKGTRLAELTSETPKGLAHIGDKPILWHVMNIFAGFGHTRFILCVGYQGQKIAKWFRDGGAEKGWEVAISDAGVDATKSQRLAAALREVRGTRFFLAYGDDLADVDLDGVCALSSQTDATVTLTAVQPYSPFGVLKIAADGRVSGFQEKSRMKEWINGGFMCVSTRIKDYLRLGELEKEVFEALVREGRLVAFRHSGFWKAMNTHKQYLEFNELCRQGMLPWQRKA